MRFIGTMLDIKNVDKFITVNDEGEEEGHMCKAVEDLMEEGRIEGMSVEEFKKAMEEMVYSNR